MDKPFSPSTNTPFKAENFYLQVIVTKLICKRAHISKDCNYTFGIFKGSRQFQTTKEVTVPGDCHSSLPLDKFKLNFMVNSYNPEKSNDFRIRMTQSIDSTHAKEVGEYILNANNYIDKYHISENGSFDLTVDLNEDFAADLELYLDSNQHGLYRLIRDIKNPKKNQETQKEAPVKIMRQRIADSRSQMDLETQREGKDKSKDKKFARFSPRKDIISEEKRKADMFAHKKEDQQVTRVENLRRQGQESAETESPKKKKGPIPIKKEWIIPAAEEIKQQIARSAKIKRKSSQSSEQKIEEQTKSGTSSKNIQKSQNKGTQAKPSFSETSQINLRWLIPLLVIILAGASYLLLFFRTGDQAAEKGKVLKPKKAGKVQKGGKGSNGKGKGKGKK